MANEASFSVSGYVATEPKLGVTKSGVRSLYMRVGWTPRWLDRTTGDWNDQPTSFVSVVCYRRVAQNAGACLRRGDPIVLRGTLRVREFGEEGGPRQHSVDVVAESIGHDLARGTTHFTRRAAHVEMTAEERELALAAAERQAPLPGDRPAAERGPGPDPEDSYAAEPEIGDGQAPDTEAGVEDFDEEAARAMMASAAEEPGALGASR
jgi:single-strand DNA-binding protein